MVAQGYSPQVAPSWVPPLPAAWHDRELLLLLWPRASRKLFFFLSFVFFYLCFFPSLL